MQMISEHAGMLELFDQQRNHIDPAQIHLKIPKTVIRKIPQKQQGCSPGTPHKWIINQLK